jgi:EAL domain-containing protein (putative c-di-GMP-specific phosphodiesterase class I)
VSLETYLRNAVDCDELTLQYQPRVSVANGRMVGVEALVRWRHPVLGLVPPARFIHVAEETGLIEEIDMWVLREACTRVARWQAAGLGPLRVSVNLSARQFQQVGLAGRVRSVLAETGLAPACLELEITEGTVMHDLQAAQAVLQSLKQIGVVLSIDDFGTGYSSLSYLKRFPIDVLKIDRSFIMDVIDDPNDAAITRAIIAVAHGLELEAVAEGVETAEQVAFLRANGCDEIQGYFFSPPVWPDQLEGMLGGVKENFVSAPALQ